MYKKGLKKQKKNEHTYTVPTIHPTIASLDLLIYVYLRTLSTIILCSLYLVFIFLREGLATRRAPFVDVLGKVSVLSLIASLHYSLRVFPIFLDSYSISRDETRRDETGSATRRSDLANYRFTVLYTVIFRKLHSVCTL